MRTTGIKMDSDDKAEFRFIVGGGTLIAITLCSLLLFGPSNGNVGERCQEPAREYAVQDTLYTPTVRDITRYSPLEILPQ